MDLEEQYNESPPSISEFTDPSVPNNAKEADDDDPPTQSPYALEALKEFLTEEHRAAATVAKTAASGASSSKVSLISEDWRLSQFWYTPETAETVSEEVLKLLNCLTTNYPSIACIACPTLFGYPKGRCRESAAKLLGLHPCGFRLQHSCKLGNEFWLYTNYDPGNRLNGWQSEDGV